MGNELRVASFSNPAAVFYILKNSSNKLLSEERLMQLLILCKNGNFRAAARLWDKMDMSLSEFYRYFRGTSLSKDFISSYRPATLQRLFKRKDCDLLADKKNRIVDEQDRLEFIREHLED